MATQPVFDSTIVEAGRRVLFARPTTQRSARSPCRDASTDRRRPLPRVDGRDRNRSGPRNESACSGRGPRDRPPIGYSGVLFGESRYAGLRDIIKVKPPLDIPYEQLNQALDVLDEVIAELAADGVR
jgi:hypothetical protein